MRTDCLHSLCSFERHLSRPAPPLPAHALLSACLPGCLPTVWPAGQEVVVHAVGAQYTSWEGYVEEGSGRAMIGLSYDKLCQFVKPGSTILMSDGTITLQVCLEGCLHLGGYKQ